MLAARKTNLITAHARKIKQVLAYLQMLARTIRYPFYAEKKILGCWNYFYLHFGFS